MFKKGDYVRIKSKTRAVGRITLGDYLNDHRVKQSKVGVVCFASSKNDVRVNPPSRKNDSDGWSFTEDDLELIDENTVWHMQEVGHEN